jgi:hypothetical protein
MQKFYASFSLKLMLRHANSAEKARLQGELGVSGAEESFFSLGSICMREAFEEMRKRFARLPELCKDCVRAPIRRTLRKSSARSGRN